MSVFTNPASASTENARAYIAAILETVGDRDPVAVLERTPGALRRAIAGLSAEQCRTPEAPGKWSIAQVLQHLADSEIVWSWRLRMVLAHDRPLLTGYDQDLWAQRLGYEHVEAADALRHFDVLREANLRVLRAASPRDMQRIGLHEERGEESVEHMLRLYAGHDMVHERQIERIGRAVQG